MYGIPSSGCMVYRTKLSTPHFLTQTSIIISEISHVRNNMKSLLTKINLWKIITEHTFFSSKANSTQHFQMFYSLDGRNCTFGSTVIILRFRSHACAVGQSKVDNVDLQVRTCYLRRKTFICDADNRSQLTTYSEHTLQRYGLVYWKNCSQLLYLLNELLR